MTESEPPAPETSFLANVNLVFLTYVANAALAFGVAVVVARALGPEGRGVYALVLLSASIAQAVLNLGMGVAAVYELGKGSAPAARVLANTQQVVVFSAAVSGALVLLAWPLIVGRLLDEDVPFWGYFCQITDAQPSYGRYSGAPANEKITWGKLDPSTPRFEINSDASIVAPLIFGYVLGD